MTCESASVLKYVCDTSDIGMISLFFAFPYSKYYYEDDIHTA